MPGQAQVASGPTRLDAGRHRKALSNLAKHGVSIADAATVFADPFAVYFDDGFAAMRTVVIGASIRDCVRLDDFAAFVSARASERVLAEA